MTNKQIKFATLELGAESGLATIISLSGELDEVTNDSVFDAVRQYFELNPELKYFIFDCAELVYLNSRSIGHLMEFYNKIIERSGKMVIMAVNDDISDTLDLVGVGNVIDIVAGLPQAHATLVVDINS